MLLALLSACGGATQATRAPVATSAVKWSDWEQINEPTAEHARCSLHDDDLPAWTLRQSPNGIEPSPLSADASPSQHVLVPRRANPEHAWVFDADTRQSAVALEGGTLVAFDKGEFGGGLFWLPEQTGTIEPMPVPSVEPIRRIEKLSFGIIGIAGLCHGSDERPTTFYRIEPGPPPSHHGTPLLKLSELGSVSGCATKVSVASDRQSLVVLSQRGLDHLSVIGLKTVSKLPYPFALRVAPGDAVLRDQDGSLFVSFGPLVARFAANDDAVTWFAPSTCISMRGDPDHGVPCTCESAKL